MTNKKKDQPRSAARRALDVWVLARQAHDVLSDLHELEPRQAYLPAMSQAFSAELDAAEQLHRRGIEVQRRAAEDPTPHLGRERDGADES